MTREDWQRLYERMKPPTCNVPVCKEPTQEALTSQCVKHAEERGGK